MKLITSISCLTFLILCSCHTGTNKTNSEKQDIIFKDSSGHSLTRNDLANVTGQINYEIVSNQTIDPTAKGLHNEAIELGQAGKYDLSIAKLEKLLKFSHPGHTLLMIWLILIY
ncbi:hypothetical protein SAMN05518672_102362 [Chitinophaga sp. CF118]|uniref:hypothetical protein n=1 Tax=Chitinophaga sp. CF118 TaxID=1884367 RepID=UPI0008F1D2B1|nr:hypothetical protein [Chitinophaga sp. CF118]SFD54268.1 hypothetical protein SAMN05518672_102362 [Chitinophaga sp. CF118]